MCCGTGGGGGDSDWCGGGKQSEPELTLLSRTVKLSTIVQLLHFIRGTVTERLMNAVAIIKALDVIEDRQFRLISGSEVMVMHPFILQVGEKLSATALS
jgi:hypothetical protein